jgi:hypothetical protein
LRHVFAVPGNHDVDWSADKDRNLARLVRSLREGTENLDTVLADKGDRAQLAQRMANYLNLSADLAPFCLRDAQEPTDRIWWSHQLDTHGGMRVRLVGLNTAIISAESPDHGKLLLGKETLAHAFANSSSRDDELIIVLSHHPFRDGWLSDQRESDAWVRSHAHIHLSGHVHAADLEESRSGSGSSFIRIVAGAIHEEKQSDGLPAGHGYSVASVFQGKDGMLKLRVWPRKWSDKNKDFRLDVENVRPGSEFAEHDLARVKLPNRPGLR